MNRYSGTIIDIIFVAAFLFIAPYLVGALSFAANTNPNIYVYTTTLIIAFHPLMCWAILQKIGTEPVLQQGLLAFNKGLWRWYSWPLGLLVYYAIFGHSLAVLFLSATFGEWKRVEPSVANAVALILSVLFCIGIASMLLFRLFRGKKKDAIKKTEEPGKKSLSSKLWVFIFIISLILLIPFLLLIWLAIGLIYISCLYFIVWVFASSMVRTGDPNSNDVRNLAFLPDTKFSRIASSILLFIYTLVLAFYFDKITTDAIFNSPLSYGQACFFNAQFLLLFYVPFRLFFALYAGKSKLGWTTFGLSVIVTYLSIII